MVKREIKQLKRIIKVITGLYLVSLTALILSINYILPENKKQAKILFSEMVIKQTLNDSKYKQFFNNK